MILFIKGLLIGLGQIIPGVSGGMIAISLNVYEYAIDCISNFFSNPTKNFKFLIKVGTGILLSIILCSKLIKYCIINYYLITMLLFIGLIIGGIPTIYKQIKNNKNTTNYLLLIITFLSIIFISFFSFDNDIIINDNSFVIYFHLFIVGIIYATCMVVPGISGTAILMMIGYYEIIINILSNLTNIKYIFSNFLTIVFFIFGIVFGIVIISKLMNHCLNKYHINTYYVIFGLLLSSVVIMIIKAFECNFSRFELIIGLLLLIMGYTISYKFEK